MCTSNGGVSGPTSGSTKTTGCSLCLTLLGDMTETLFPARFRVIVAEVVGVFEFLKMPVSETTESRHPFLFSLHLSNTLLQQTLATFFSLPSTSNAILHNPE